MKKIITILAICLLTGIVFGPSEFVNTTVNGSNVKFTRTVGTLGPGGNGLGYFNVKDYGAVGNGVANDTKPIQDAIDAAGNGTVFIPSGTYLVGSLKVKYATNIIGAGWSDRYEDGGTVIKTTSNLPIFHIVNTPPHLWSDGASIKDLHILGNSHANKGDSKQTGILITTEGPVLIERVFISNCGDYGIRLGTLAHTTCIEISKCRIFQNVKGGIYGRYSDAQINAIHILNCEIDQNGFGINLLGTNVIIRDNIIQGNDSSGIFMSARDLGAVNCSSTHTLIDGNYLEANRGGEIYIEEYYKTSPEVIQYHSNIEISNNYFLTMRRLLLKPGVNACITVKKASGSELVYGISDLHIRNNNKFIANGGSIWIDGGNILNFSCSIEIPSTIYPTTVVKNVRYGAVMMDGESTSTLTHPFSSINARSGIVLRDLHPVLQLAMDTQINLTVNPQIAAGFVGQKITIIGNSDKYTLTLDDGNGLQLAGNASCVLGLNDVISLIYTGTDWIEISRSNN